MAGDLCTACSERPSDVAGLSPGRAPPWDISELAHEAGHVLEAKIARPWFSQFSRPAEAPFLSQ